MFVQKKYEPAHWTMYVELTQDDTLQLERELGTLLGLLPKCDRPNCCHYPTLTQMVQGIREERLRFPYR